MVISAPDLVTRYFTAQSTRDFDTLLTLSAEDAVVVGEGRTQRSTRENRAWREDVAAAYEYSRELRGVASSGDGTYIADVHLEGNCPGGTVDLVYRFRSDR